MVLAIDGIIGFTLLGYMLCKFDAKPALVICLSGTTSRGVAENRSSLRLMPAGLLAHFMDRSSPKPAAC